MRRPRAGRGTDGWVSGPVLRSGWRTGSELFSHLCDEVKQDVAENHERQ